MTDEISNKELLLSGLSALGEKLKKGADEVRKTVGVGVGNVELEVPAMVEHGGELQGKVLLELTEPVEATAVRVKFIGERNVNRRVKESDGEVSTRLTKERIYEQILPLAGEGTYQDEEFSFVIPIPNAKGEVQIDGVVGDLVKAAQVLHAMTQGMVQWRVVAEVVVPWRRNIGKQQTIVVR